MTTFDSDAEIDNMINKFSDQLKNRIKTIVSKAEKQAVKNYIANQKESTKTTKKSGTTSSSKKVEPIQYKETPTLRGKTESFFQQEDDNSSDSDF
jgi:hypothetical protein